LQIDLPHAVAGSVPAVACPFVISGERPVAATGPPVLGAHTSEVLSSLLGLSADETEALRSAGVV
jgi:crotonobetainyl-CoA:carnitine CoA-transferase CaiB-like acyl-CoA transferase